MFEKLSELETRYNALQEQIADPAVMADLSRYREMLKSISEIENLVSKFRELKMVRKRIQDTREMLASLKGEEELRELGELELAELEQRQPVLEKDLLILLEPKDPNDEKNVFVE